MKQYFFLSGLQRSGSTLLGALLNQNPQIYVSPTSPLLDYLFLSEDLLRKLEVQYTYDINSVSKNIHRSTIDNFYRHIDKPIIIDKHRGWTKNIDTFKIVTDMDAKVLCTYRPIEETIVSFIKLAKKDPENAIDRELVNKGLEITDKNRAIYVWENWTYDIYDSLRYGVKNNPDNLYIVHYNKLINETQNELDRIYDFIGLEKFTHKLSNIDNTCSEQKDEIWGFKGLHDVRPTISNESLDPSKILDDELLRFFRKYDELLGIGEAQ